MQIQNNLLYIYVYHRDKFQEYNWASDSKICVTIFFQISCNVDITNMQKRISSGIMEGYLNLNSDVVIYSNPLIDPELLILIFQGIL